MTSPNSSNSLKYSVVSNTRMMAMGLLASIALFLAASAISSVLMLRQISSVVRERALTTLQGRLIEAAAYLPSGVGHANKELSSFDSGDFEAFLSRMVAEDTIGVTIIDNQGEVRASTMTGYAEKRTATVAEALAGRVAWTQPSDAELDVFLPLRRSQAVIGAVAIMQNWTAERDLVAQLSWWLWTGTAVTMVLVSLIVWSIYRSLNRSMRRRHRALSAILDQAPIGIYTVTPSGVIDTFNPKMVQLAGAAGADKVLGLNIFEMPSYRQSGLTEDFRQGLKGQTFDKDVEYVSFTTNQRTWRHYRGVPIFMPDGTTVDRLLLLVEDITMQKELARKNAEYAEHLEKYAAEQSRQLARKDEQLHIVVDQLPVIFWAIDQRGTVTISEGSGLDLMGLKPNGAIGQSIFDIYRDSLETVEQINRALAGEAVTAQAQCRNHYFDNNFSPFRDDQGNVIGATGVSIDVTERARIEQRFKAMVNNAADIMTILDSRGAIAFGTEATPRVLGYQVSELLNTEFTALVHPDDLAFIRQRMTECLAQPGNVVNATYRLRHRDGHYLDVESIGQNYLDEPNIQGLVVNTRDVTERVRAEREIQHNVATQTTMAELSAKFVTVEDFGTAVNEVLREIGEFSGADCAFMTLMTGDRRVSEHFEWIKAGREQNVPSAAVFTQRLSRAEVYLEKFASLCLLDDAAITKEGEAVAAFCHDFDIHALVATPIISNGTTLGLFGIMTTTGGILRNCENQVLNVAAEVTAGALQRRAAYAESRKQAERQSAIAALGQSLLVQTTEDKILEMGANTVKDVLGAEMTVVFQYQPEQENFRCRLALGDDAFAAEHPTLPGGIHSQSGFTVMSRETIFVEDFAQEHRFTPVAWHHSQAIRSGASVIIGDRLQPWGVLNVFSSEVRSFGPDDVNFLESVAHLVGITLSRHASELKSHDLDLLKSKFIQVVSHQFRTPLSAVRWNLESLLSGDIGQLTPETREFVRITYEANNEVINRIRDLLTVLDIEERRITLNPEPIAFDSIVASVAAEFAKRLALKRLTFVNEAGRTTGSAVNLDQERVRTILEKLLDNALAYTPPGGTVTLKSELMGNRLRVTVTDTGIGIPEQEQRRVFERFYRASNASTMRPDASGLGLTIAKYFVEQQDGAIGFNSKEGVGSTFWFELPVK